jgi:hypothetical protein
MEDFKAPHPSKLKRSGADFAEQRVMDGEAESVWELCRVLKLPPKFRNSLKDTAKRKDRDQPNLEDLRDVWADFPIFLLYGKQKDLRANASLGNLFPASTFRNQWFVKHLLAERDNLEHVLGSSPICLLLSWPYMTGKMALHTMARDARAPGLRIMFTPDTKKVPSLTLEPFSQLLTSIAPRLGLDLSGTDDEQH